MAIEKFRFVSPGVQINEIDDSIIQPPQPAIGPVIIGNTSKGPSMQPVQVSTIAELERIFGTPSNGNAGAQDVWRTGVATSPTLATYAARAFLRNSFPLTVVRLAGVPMNPATQSGQPGWSTDKVYHLFSCSGSLAKVAANFYADANTTISLSGSVSGSPVTGSKFTLTIVRSSVTQSFTASFDPTSNDFIRNTFVTNPSLLASAGYFLGESYENNLIANGNAYQLLTGSSDFKNFKNYEGATSAESAWVVGDISSGSLSNTYAYSKLFRFRGLNNGSYLSKDIKISIENIRPSKNKLVTFYGTFDVVVRKLFESQNLSVLERFNNLTLDPDSENNIVRRIGDAYRAWNTTSQRYEEFGTYSNKSSYIRVELSDLEDVEKVALPRGFVIKGMPKNSAYTNPYATVTHPNISLKSEMKLSSAKSSRFGLLSEPIENADLVDILAQKPFNVMATAASLEDDKIFHTRFLTSSGGTVSKLLYSDNYYDTTDLFASGSFLGFDLPVYFGFEGKDITVRESFLNNGELETGTPNENSNAAYRAIKQAIDIVSQPELVDMNLISIPGLQKKELTDYLIDVAKSRGDCLAVVDLVGDYRYSFENANGKESRPTSVKEVVENLQSRVIDNSYGAAYFPAVFVPTEGIFMPASVAAVGAIGGTEGRSALWFAPAGFNRGGLTLGNSGISVSRTAFPLISSDRDSLYENNINPIATFPNEGVVIFGQKTLQKTPSALDRVNVRRLVNFLKKQISRIGTRILFEPNVEATWNRFKNIVEPFLENVKSSYGLDDALVLLNNATTTADLVDRNTMYCKIFIKPTRAIEYIAIDFVVTNSGASFNEG